MGTPYDKNNPLHALIIGPNGPIPQKYDPEANSGQGGMVPSTVDDVQKVTQIGSMVANESGTIPAESGFEKDINIINYTKIGILWRNRDADASLRVHLLNEEGSAAYAD